MTKAEITREKLLETACEAFWHRGYANVPLRDISKAAGVDVALIARYFGSKRGLFEAALETAFDWPEMLDADAGSPMDVAITKFSAPETDADETSATRMILMNAADPEVGEIVRAAFQEKLLDPLLVRMGGDQSAPNLAMFIAVFLGASVVRQSLRLPGMADQSAQDYARQLRHLVDAALSFKV
jgi:AcrR family transcriptional regulator